MGWIEEKERLKEMLRVANGRDDFLEVIIETIKTAKRLGFID